MKQVIYNIYHIKRSVAQLVEQLPCKEKVVGSSPTASTKQFLDSLLWLERSHDRDGTGSIPVREANAG